CGWKHQEVSGIWTSSGEGGNWRSNRRSKHLNIFRWLLDILKWVTEHLQVATGHTQVGHWTSSGGSLNIFRWLLDVLRWVTGHLQVRYARLTSSRASTRNQTKSFQKSSRPNTPSIRKTDATASTACVSV
ncbi:hypothetical protein AVEN_32773-1, partial [Araneus ventricosus]